MSARFSFSEMALHFDKMIYAKRAWLSDFSDGRSKRPDHEIETKATELEVLEQAAADYRHAATRREA